MCVCVQSVCVCLCMYYMYYMCYILCTTYIYITYYVLLYIYIYMYFSAILYILCHSKTPYYCFRQSPNSSRSNLTNDSTSTDIFEENELQIEKPNLTFESECKTNSTQHLEAPVGDCEALDSSLTASITHEHDDVSEMTEGTQDIKSLLHMGYPARGLKSVGDEGHFQVRFPAYPVRNFMDIARSFNPEWYNAFPWLEYSTNLDAAFCYPCRCYRANYTIQGWAERTFVIEGFTNWKKALEKDHDLHGHDTRVQHRTSLLFWQDRQLNKKEKTDISVAVHKGRPNEAERHWKHIERIIESLIWLAMQGLALHGHNEDECSDNRGNFLELLELRSRDIPELKDYLQKETFKSKSPN